MKKLLTLLSAVAAMAGLSVIPLAAQAHTPHSSIPGLNLHTSGSAHTGKPAGLVRPRGSHASAALGGGNLLYHGGPVQSNIHIHIIFWGNWWASSCPSQLGNGSADETYLFNYFHGMGTSADGLSRVQTQYNDSSGNRPQFGGTVFKDWAAYCSDPPASATDSDLAAVAVAYATYLAAHGTPIGRSDQIDVVSPSGTNPGGGFGTQYCAYHNVTTYNSALLSWTNMPYLPDAGSSCGANIISGPLDGWGIVSGHEYAESATDPFVNVQSAWYDSAGFEIGDKCAWTNIFVETLPTGSFAQQPEWSNALSACAASDTVTVTYPGSRFTNLGANVNFQIHASSDHGLALHYSASGLPNGLSFNNSTGLITGHPTVPGDFTTTVYAQETATAVLSFTQFAWEISPVHGHIALLNHNTHCMAGGLTTGTGARLYGCSTNSTETWAAWTGRLERYGTSGHIFTNRCLFETGTGNGSHVTMQPCSGASSEHWTYSGNQWKNAASGKCLNDPGSNLANGTQLVIWSCTGDPVNERWTTT